MKTKTYYLVSEEILPEVYLRVIKAKELLKQKAFPTVAECARQAGVSRSTYYKYQNKIFNMEPHRGSVVMSAVIADAPGAFAAFLQKLSSYGALVEAVDLIPSSNGTASARITLDTARLNVTVSDLILQLQKNSFVVSAAIDNA